MILTSTSDIVRVVTSAAVNVDVQANWADITTSAFTAGRTNTKITTATTTTVVASPAASTQRQVKSLIIRNVHASSGNTVTIEHYDGTNSVIMFKVVLDAGESVAYAEGQWHCYNANGSLIHVDEVGTLPDGDYGDITVSGGVWTIDANVVLTTPSLGVASAEKIAANYAGVSTTPVISAIHSADNASVIPAVFAGQRATQTDGDTAKIALRLADDTNTATNIAVIEWTATDVSNGAVKGRMKLGVFSNNVLTSYIQIDDATGEITYSGKLSGATKPRVLSISSAATPTINTDSYDLVNITALAVDITSMTTNLSGTPLDGQQLAFAITGTATRAITWGASFENGSFTLPTTTSGTTRLDVFFVWNSVTSKWRCILTLASSGAGDALTSGTLAQFAATTSLQLKGVISDETGSGSLVFADTPTLVTPVLGVASATSVNKVAITAPATGSTLTIADGATLTVNGSATITNGTHSGTNTGDQTNITGNAATVTVADAGADTTTWPLLGTSATGSLAPATDAGLTYNASTNALTTTTFIGALTGTASGNLVAGGALGTPSSAILTNATGLPVSGITASTVTALGVGSIELGHATDTSITRVSAGVAAVEGKNIALNGTSEALTTGTIELGAASDTTISRSAAGVIAVEGVVIPSISSTNTLTNKRVTPRTGTTTSSATPTINTDNVDYYSLTAQTVDITSFTTNLSGTPTEGQKLWISITGTAARAITWGASFEASTIALPTTTVTTNRLDVGFIWNTVTSKWRCVGVA